MVSKLIKKFNLGFTIGDEVTVNEDLLYYSYSQFVKIHKKYAPHWQYKCWINKDGLPLKVIGIYKDPFATKKDKDKLVIVIQDRYKRIYLVAERGVSKVVT